MIFNTGQIMHGMVAGYLELRREECLVAAVKAANWMIASQDLAPAANPERLTDAAKIEKWFRRNCNDVLGRACTPAEKGDVIAWLTSLKQ